MSRRFYVPGVHLVEGRALAAIGEQEAHHLLHVMRAKVADEVVVFDGSGFEYSARVERIEKRQVWVEVSGGKEVSREPTTRLSIGVALPKGDRQQWLCEKLVELGCFQLTPLITQRGVAEAGEGALARLRRFVIEASKQCGRNRLMEIGAPCTVDAFLSAEAEASRRLFLDGSGELFRADTAANSGEAWRAAVGPEGGWTAQELARAREQGWPIGSLGARVLRVETAAAALCSRICLD